MRTVIFRVLAGLLSPLLVWTLLSGNFAAHSLREKFGAWVVAVAFALYAIFGSDMADSMLCLWFEGGYKPGGHSGKKPLDGDKSQLGGG